MISLIFAVTVLLALSQSSPVADAAKPNVVLIFVELKAMEAFRGN